MKQPDTTTPPPPVTQAPRVRPEGYYWVRVGSQAPDILFWNATNREWCSAARPDYTWEDDYWTVPTVVLYGPLHLHCYNRSCLRGSGACGRVTAESAPESFRLDGCECECSACCAARGAVNWTEERA